jgi:hypothetical protein
MGAQIVTAMYRPKPGKAEELEALVRRHQPALRAAGLVTERPTILMRSAADGTFVEIFEWASGEAARSAHEDEAVGALWTAMEAVADFVTLADLPEATRRFPHFTPLT